MILLQAAPFDYTIIMLMMGIFLVVQFVIIGPKQKKKEKEMLNYISNLPNGAKVVTTGGIHGKFLKMDENILVIEVDTNVKLRVDKSAINFEATKALNPA
jgi:preprotein translocase subunit YajC